MNYLSLLALSSILLAVPACRESDVHTQRTTTTTVAPTTEGAVEVSEYVDKEDLDEQELIEVMNNK